MEEEQDDPFAFLTERCKPTPSQEEILRTCPFSRQSETFPGDSDADSPPPETFDGIPVDPTGIVMVSPPDEFQTPTEDSLPAASSQDQRPTPPPTAVHVGGEENVSSTDAENLSCADAERAVDLGKDSDNVGFLEVNLTEEVVDGVSSSNGVVDACEVFQSELEEFVVLPRASNLAVDNVVSLGSVPKKSKLPFISLWAFDPAIARSSTAEKQPVVSDTNRVNDNAMTEVLDLEVEGIGEQLGEVRVDNVFVDLPLKETHVNIGLSEGDEVVRNGKGDMGRKNIEDLDKFRYVNPNGVVKRKISSAGGRRELPPSISKGGNVAAEEMGWGNMVAKDKIFKGLLDALKMVAGQLDGGGSEGEGDVDFLETAKKRGMTLPRPRWWPPEGYDD